VDLKDWIFEKVLILSLVFRYCKRKCNKTASSWSWKGNFAMTMMSFIRAYV